MSHVSIRAYGRLNDFLPIQRRQRLFLQEFRGHPSIKDLIEATGIPHPEIELILVDQCPVDFSYRVRDGDRVSIYPRFRQINVSSLRSVGPPSPNELRFVLDTHLGRLARYLRMLGFDTRYQNDFDDPTLERLSVAEERILLTQDVGLLKRSSITHGYFVRGSDPLEQLIEIAAEFDLLESATPFRRCLRCNGELHSVVKHQIEHLLLPRTRAEFNEFYRCEKCGTIYWKGSHYDRMIQIINDVKSAMASLRRSCDAAG